MIQIIKFFTGFNRANSVENFSDHYTQSEEKSTKFQSEVPKSLLVKMSCEKNFAILKCTYDLPSFSPRQKNYKSGNSIWQRAGRPSSRQYNQKSRPPISVRGEFPRDPPLPPRVDPSRGGQGVGDGKPAAPHKNMSVDKKEKRRK